MIGPLRKPSTTGKTLLLQWSDTNWNGVRLISEATILCTAIEANVFCNNNRSKKKTSSELCHNSSFNQNNSQAKLNKIEHPLTLRKAVCKATEVSKQKQRQNFQIRL